MTSFGTGPRSVAWGSAVAVSAARAGNAVPNTNHAGSASRAAILSAAPDRAARRQAGRLVATCALHLKAGLRVGIAAA